MSRSTPGTAVTGPVAPDPRPRISTTGPAVVGTRCTACRYPSLEALTRCPLCRAAMTGTAFDTTGTVFSATVLRIPVGDRQPPVALAYVDLDDGPRLLGHGRDRERLPAPGARVELVGRTAHGNPEFAEAAS